MKIKLGDYNTLTIVKAVDFGLYLDGGDEGEMQRFLSSCSLPKELTPFHYFP